MKILYISFLFKNLFTPLVNLLSENGFQLLGHPADIFGYE